MNQVYKMKHLQSFKKDGMNIILVKNKEKANYLSKEYRIMKVVYNISGSLIKLQISLKAGAE
jgi:hypothetical protein